jgi:hypothetical protein
VHGFDHPVDEIDARITRYTSSGSTKAREPALFCFDRSCFKARRR